MSSPGLRTIRTSWLWFAVFISCLKIVFCFASDIISVTNGAILLCEVTLVVVAGVAAVVAAED
ncbi:MAG: hypothetical protein WAL66_19695 [Nitrososphaeraceae archaeon]